MENAGDHIRETTVLFIWQVPERLQNYLKKGLRDLEPHVNLIFPFNLSEEHLIQEAPKADIIVGWRPPRKLLLAAKRQILHINPGAGVQHLIELFREVNSVRETPLLLANGHGNSYFTAQHAVALLLYLSNKILLHDRWMREGQWRKGDADARSIPLRFRNIGLLGYGAVNQKVHKFLSGFNVDFHILRRSWEGKNDPLPTPAKKYSSLQLHEFLEHIDTLIIAVPQTSKTVGLIGIEELRLLGSSGLLINMARGVVVDEESLFISLKENIIAGAGLDVWYNYQPIEDENGKKYPYSYQFHTLDNVVLSPHRGASPMNDLIRWDEVVENITRMATGRNDLLNIVNLDNEY